MANLLTQFRGYTSLASIPGVMAWYDFSDASTLWQDAGRTSAITADGQTIKGVTDKSTARNHLSEATNGPTYKTAIRNGRSVARFDGVNDILTSAAFAATSQPFTVFWAGVHAAWDALHTDPTVFDGLGLNSLRYYRGTTIDTVQFAGGSNGATELQATIEAWSTVSLFYSGASSVIRRNGTSVGAGNAGTSTITGFTLGHAAGTIRPFPGDTGELIIINSALSSIQVNGIGRDLASKWGTTWTAVS